MNGPVEDAGATTGEPAAAPPTSRFGRRLAAGALIGLVVYGLMALWADFDGLVRALRQLPPARVVEALLLASAGYLARFVRWERYRMRLGIQLQRGTSLMIFLAGFAGTVSPGKLGEALKSWLVREVDGSPLSRSAPIVVAERITDLLALLMLIAIGGLGSHPEYAWMFWATLAVCAALIVPLARPALAKRLMAPLALIPGTSKITPRVDRALDSTAVLMAPRELPLAILPALAAWGLEALAFQRLASPFFAVGPEYTFALFAFCLPLVAGAVAIFTPGGLGVTEGLMATLLVERLTVGGLAAGVAGGAAAAITMVTRLCTLWFALAVGLTALVLFRRSRGRAAPARPSGAATGS